MNSAIQEAIVAGRLTSTQNLFLPLKMTLAVLPSLIVRIDRCHPKLFASDF
jgi:hypothetical protein